MAEVRINGDKVLSQESYGFLAQANLMRVRGQWDDAVALCTKAMELDPDNASVPSLLGDIYENQGKLEEASRWYSLALDKNPSSPADLLKLSRVSQELDRHAVSEAPVLLTDQSWASENGRAADRPASFDHRTMTVVLRIAAYVLAAAFIGLVAYSFTIPISHGAHNAPPPSPMVTPSTSFVLEAPTPAGPVPSPRDQAEQTLLTDLSSDSALSAQGVTIADISNDPRSGQITVTALYTPSGQSNASQSQILRAALSTAMETSVHTDTNVSGFTIRVLLQNTSGQSDSLTFTGDISRAMLLTVGSDAASVPDDQLVSKFTNPWWAPGFPS